MSLINREDALAQLATLCPDQFSGVPGHIIKRAPAIEAEKHGRWIEVSDGSGYVGEPCEACSVCGMQTDYPSNYCPNCGAKMDGGEDE